MKIKNKLFLAITTFIIGITSTGYAQNINKVSMPEIKKVHVRKEIKIPDILGYQTIKCDFHIHTMLSDGIVWPADRVVEAWEEGLDAIAITDHIEGYPKKSFLGCDHNTSYKDALPRAKEKDIILIHGAEITRSTPPGHFNGLFLSDANALDTPDFMDAILAVRKQDGFILWNHPGWKSDRPNFIMWDDIHDTLFNSGLIDGIEVFNEKEWYPPVLDWCIKKNIAVIGNSDIHDICAHYYDVEKGHRPMTLVFAEERSIEAIKTAMFEKRTVAWFNNMLAGKKEYLNEIFNAAVQVSATDQKGQTNLPLYKIENSSSIPFQLKDKKGQTILVAPESFILLEHKKNKADFIVTNLFIASNSNLRIKMNFN